VSRQLNDARGENPYYRFRFVQQILTSHSPKEVIGKTAVTLSTEGDSRSYSLDGIDQLADGIKRTS
jgi:hypothetical protein